jgi:CheY-like chemotaxis protein
MLIVDDNKEVREVMAVIVDSLGYDVLTAGDAAGALSGLLAASGSRPSRRSRWPS